MTSPWTGRPANWGVPGHVNKGDEAEEILDQLEYVSGAHPVITKYKTANTDRSNANTGATLTTDPHLSGFTAVADGVYVVELEVNTTIGAGGLNTQFTIPSGTGESPAYFYNNGTATYAQSGYLKLSAGASPIAVVAGYVAGANAGFALRKRVTVFVGSTGGTINFQWSQNSSNAANSSVLKGSWMKVQRVA